MCLVISFFTCVLFLSAAVFEEAIKKNNLKKNGYFIICAVNAGILKDKYKITLN